MRLSRQILNDAKRVMAETDEMADRRRKGLRSLSDGLSAMSARMRQMLKQTKARIFQGLTKLPGKIVKVSLSHTWKSFARARRATDGVRQAGAVAGSRKSDHHAL
jgi:hypothetical protein